MDETLKVLLTLNSIGLDGRILHSLDKYEISTAYILKEKNFLLNHNLITDKQIIKITDKLNSSWVENELTKACNSGFKIVTCNDTEYPHQLFDLRDYPLVLYLKGDMDCLKKTSLSVVGTRRASSYAKRVAADIGKSAAFNDALLVSGGALGIDSCAHSGACDDGGSTCVVMGTSPVKIFPASNANLFSRITEKGLLMSEFSFDSETKPWNFPKRNRIIAALSRKLIVVEAPEKSGALITARISMELGREVWAVPGRITDDSASGSNRLIYDGAYPYISDNYFWENTCADTSGKSVKKKNITEELNLSVTDKAVLDFIKQNEEQTADSIARGISCNSSEILISLSILTVKGLIYKSGTGRYSAG